MQHYSLAVVLLIGLPLIPHWLQAAPASLGPLSPYVQADASGGWSVSDDGSAAYLENQQSGGAIRYYYVFSPPEDEGKRSISVDVGFGFSTSQSMAGLLYGYSENPKTYFLITVGGDRSINIHQWVDGGLEELLKLPDATLIAEKTTLLVEEQGQSVTVSVNGTVLDTFTDNQLGRGGVGIVATDIGQFKFSNFSVSQSASSSVFTTPGAQVPPATLSTGPESTVSTEKTAAVPRASSALNNSAANPGASASSGNMSSENRQTANKEATRYFPSPDRRFNGMVSHYTPYPASWKQLTDNKEYLYEGPNGIKISGAFGQTFQFSNYPDGLQLLQMQGQKNTPPYSLQQIIDEFFMPVAKEAGRELTRTYALPTYAQNQADFQARLFKSVPVQQKTEAYALEWKDQQGLSYVTALTITVSQSFPTSTWFMQGQYLVAENSHFEAARDAYLYGLEHTEVNPQWLQLVNQQDAQRAGQSWAAHQSRMSAIKARGEASRSIANIYSEISDISHAGYLSRSAVQSHGHSASIRANNETTLIADHNTGEHYLVEGNNNFHWVNSNGVHIATDNPLFDPRTDEQLKMFNWTQFQKE